MHRSLILAVLLLAISACATTKPPAPDPKVPATPIIVEKPVTVTVEKRVYVPIDVDLRRIVIQQRPLWQCELERDELRAGLGLANDKLEQVDAI